MGLMLAVVLVVVAWTVGGGATAFAAGTTITAASSKFGTMLWGPQRQAIYVFERRDGRRQVTYRGRPLYSYAHEDSGEVRCHNVFLNGGDWRVIGADGRRRPSPAM